MPLTLIPRRRTAIRSWFWPVRWSASSEQTITPVGPDYAEIIGALPIKRVTTFKYRMRFGRVTVTSSTFDKREPHMNCRCSLAPIVGAR